MKFPTPPLRDSVAAQAQALNRLVEQTMERRHELLVAFCSFMLIAVLQIITLGIQFARYFTCAS